MSSSDHPRSLESCFNGCEAVLWCGNMSCNIRRAHTADDLPLSVHSYLWSLHASSGSLVFNFPAEFITNNFSIRSIRIVSSSDQKLQDHPHVGINWWIYQDYFIYWYICSIWWCSISKLYLWFYYDKLFKYPMEYNYTLFQITQQQFCQTKVINVSWWRKTDISAKFWWCSSLESD